MHERTDPSGEPHEQSQGAVDGQHGIIRLDCADPSCRSSRWKRDRLISIITWDAFRKSPPLSFGSSRTRKSSAERRKPVIGRYGLFEEWCAEQIRLNHQRRSRLAVVSRQHAGDQAHPRDLHPTPSPSDPPPFSIHARIFFCRDPDAASDIDGGIPPRIPSAWYRAPRSGEDVKTLGERRGAFHAFEMVAMSHCCM